MSRYPLLTIYAAISRMLAVMVGSLTVVASFGMYLWLADSRGGGQAGAAAIAVAILGLLYALVLGVSADVIRWMFDLVQSSERCAKTSLSLSGLARDSTSDDRHASVGE